MSKAAAARASSNHAGSNLRIDSGEMLQLFETMLRIRTFEEKAAELFKSGVIKGTAHSYAGQEAIAAGACLRLTKGDYIGSYHRGHGHCIAKGCDIDGMMHEIFGRKDGLCGGKGGSMHIADLSKGMLGANGIVGGGIPLAIGAALSAKVRKTGGVAVSFFGDGATNQGAFHESLNIASILKLPAVFVIENNGYGEATPVEYHVNITDLAVRATSYGIPGVIADGMDFFDVFAKASTAIERARRGEGPTLLECKTYRYFGHYVGDPLTYRSKEDVERVRDTRDPIAAFEKRVVAAGQLKESELRAADDQVAKAIAEAVKFAEASPPPETSDLLTDVYVDYPT